jgi:transketolase
MHFQMPRAHCAEMESDMVAIGNNATSTSTSPPTPAVATAPTKAAVTDAAKAATPAVVIALSDRAKATLDKAEADKAATADLTLSFDEILAKRSDALSAQLAYAFGKLNIPPEFATRLRVDKFGNVSSEGPWKEKIEKMFADAPELAKELKAVSGLNSLKAAQTALDMYNEEKKSANKQEQAEAWKTYNIRSINIQALSGVMTMKDGKLRSAAVDYIDMLADPNGVVSGKSGKEIKERLA